MAHKLTCWSAGYAHSSSTNLMKCSTISDAHRECPCMFVMGNVLDMLQEPLGYWLVWQGCWGPLAASRPPTHRLPPRQLPLALVQA